MVEKPRQNDAKCRVYYMHGSRSLVFSVNSCFIAEGSTITSQSEPVGLFRVLTFFLVVCGTVGPQAQKNGYSF